MRVTWSGYLGWGRKRGVGRVWRKKGVSPQRPFCDTLMFRVREERGIKQEPRWLASRWLELLPEPQRFLEEESSLNSRSPLTELSGNALTLSPWGRQTDRQTDQVSLLHSTLPQSLTSSRVPCWGVSCIPTNTMLHRIKHHLHHTLQCL